MDRDVIKVSDGITITEHEMMGIFIVAIFFNMISGLFRQNQPVSQLASLMAYQGRTDPRVLSANSTLQFIDLINSTPFTPWVFARITNKGPNPVKVAINNPGDLFSLDLGSYSIDRRGASERISVLFFVCDPGQTANLEIIGEY